MTLGKVLCQSLHTYSNIGEDTINRFVNIGHLPDSTRVFECGTVVNGVAEVNAYINANGTCSFINADAVTFTGLADVPHQYQNHAHNLLSVGEDENCLRFTDELTIKSVDAESVKVKDIETESLYVKNQFKVDFLEINKLIQTGFSENNLCGYTHINKADAKHLDVDELKADNLNVSKDLHINGNTFVKSINCDGLVNSGKTTLGDVTGKTFLMNTLECDYHSRIKSLEIGDNLSVYGVTVAKSINSNTITNTGNLVSHDIKSISSTFESVKADIVKADKVLTKSELVFGKVEYPQIFLPNDLRYLEFDMPMKGLRAYGYGFAPTQVLDTIIVKIKTEYKLESSDFKIGFKYYNAKDTIPSVYKLGEVLYPDVDGVVAVVKMSGNIPLAPYWVISVDIVPF